MVDLSGVFGAAFGAIFEPATLHRKAAASDDGSGTIAEGADTDYGCRAQVDAATEAMRSAEGFVDTDQRILVLSSTLETIPTTEDEITAGGRRWKIASVSRDPARTYFELRGRRAG